MTVSNFTPASGSICEWNTVLYACVHSNHHILKWLTVWMSMCSSRFVWNLDSHRNLQNA